MSCGRPPPHRHGDMLVDVAVQLKLHAVITLPGKPLAKFDIGWADAVTRRYYLADRTNARIAVVDTDALTYIGSLGDGDFAGAVSTGKTSGPNGVALLPDVGQVWAGDGE